MSLPVTFFHYQSVLMQRAGGPATTEQRPQLWWMWDAGCGAHSRSAPAVLLWLCWH